MPSEIVVIGAGIVGICAACWLQRDGHGVTVIDRDEPGSGCSFGNAGGVCPGSCVPTGMPGMLAKAPGWLLDPDGPLFVRLAYLPSALPWLFQRLQASRPARVREIADAMRALHAPTLEKYKTLMAWAGCDELLRERGQLFLYESTAELEADAFGRTLREDRGVDVQILAGDELRQMEPALAPIFAKAAYLPEQAQCPNPLRLVRALAAQFVADGGRIEQARIDGLNSSDGRIDMLQLNGRSRPIENVLLAAGAWSGELLKTIGIRVPLESERGYHVTITDADIDIRIQSVWSRRRFVASPMEMGLRLAGTEEFAGLSAPPNQKRALALVKHGREMLPGLRADQFTTWMGHRPGTPDSLPVVGRDTRYPNLFHAFGHGHTGLIGASVTGALIADLMADRQPAIDLTPYRIDRF